MIEDRRVICCSKCKETFSYLIRIPDDVGAQNLQVKLSCPFCKAKLKLDLSPYQRRVVEIYRTETTKPSEDSRLELPNEIPGLLDD